MYTEVTEGSPTDGRDDNARGFPLPTLILHFSPVPSSLVNQSKALVDSVVYHVVYHSKIPINRKAKRLEGNTESTVEGVAL